MRFVFEMYLNGDQNEQKLFVSENLEYPKLIWARGLITFEHLQKKSKFAKLHNYCSKTEPATPSSNSKFDQV